MKNRNCPVPEISGTGQNTCIIMGEIGFFRIETIGEPRSQQVILLTLVFGKTYFKGETMLSDTAYC